MSAKHHAPAEGHRSWHRLAPRIFVALVALVLMSTGLAFLQSAGSGSPLTNFEIDDGNIVQNTAVPDWGTVFGAGGVVKDAAGTTAQSFVADPLAFDPLASPPCDPGKTGDPSVFTGVGGEKNGDALDSMTWGSGSIPNNKDDLSNVYAVAKPDANGHEIIYFALERIDNNGDSHVDFEFLRSVAGMATTGVDARGCPSGNLTGSRTTGDLLVSMDFTNGGTAGTPEVRRWDGSTYNVVASSGFAGFFQNGSGPIACGDWTCRDTTGAATTTVPTNGFTEGWVDATQLGITNCYSTFMSHTRSSQPITATLKDFALGQFNTCDARISVGEDGVNEVGQQHTVTGHVEVNADGTFKPAPDGTPIEFAIVSGPGQLAPTSCLTTGGTGKCSVSLTSNTAGVTIVSASTTVNVGGVVITRTTNGNAGTGGSGNLTKRWVDASIAIAPNGVNETGTQHTFTVNVIGYPSGATPVTVDSITTDVRPAPSSQSSTCSAPVVTTNADGTVSATCTLTINSTSTGVFVVNATAQLTMGGVTVTRATSSNHGPGGSGPANKRYVDARIKIAPDGVNEVGQPHTLTATVEVDDSSGWKPAPDGTSVGFSLTSGPGSLNPASCQVSGGSCSVTLTSAIAGVSIVNASTTVVIDGVSIVRSTNGNAGPDGSGPATKRWVDASIAIAPNDVNEVGQSHTFTITVTAIPSGATPVGFPSITTSVSPAPTTQSNTCATPQIQGNVATCTLTINSDTPTIYTANAATTVTIGSVTLTRATDGNAGPGGSGPATKGYVDARIRLAPNGVNEVGSPHQITAAVEINSGAGWVPAADGTVVDLAIANGPGSLSAPSCTTTGGTGSCMITLSSTIAGTTIVSAHTAVTVVINGVSLTLDRSTHGTDGPSANLVKQWVDGSIAIVPDAVNEVGQPHTFTITAIALPAGTGAPIFGAITVTVSPAPTSQSNTCATPLVQGNVATCSLTITSNTAGVFTANASVQITMGGVTVSRSTSGVHGPGGTGPATKTYVDARILLHPDGTNEVGNPHVMTASVEVNDGSGWAPVVNGTTIDLAIVSGPGSLSSPSCTTSGGSCSVTLLSNVAGLTIVSASATTDVLGVTLTRSTSSNAGPGGTGNLTKHWVDASISIAPNGVNPVGMSHSFTITARAFPGGASPVTFDSIMTDVAPVPSSQSNTCATPTISTQPDGTATATCVLTINNTSAGTFTANASVQVTMGGVSVLRSTSGNAGPGGSGPATKTYVDARITLVGNGVNEVGNPHTLTATVELNDGARWVPAPNGTVIAFAIQSGPGSLSASSCITAAGTCSVVLTSDVAGTTVVAASSHVSIQGVDFDLVTNGQGGSSGPITKRWVDASIGITPDAVNPVGTPHVFTIVATAYPSGAQPVTFDSITTNVSPAPSSQSDTCGSPTIASGPAGTVTATCLLTINSQLPDQFQANASVTVSMGGVSVTRSTSGNHGPGGTGPATKYYVQARISVGIDGVNEVGHAHTVTGHLEVNDGTGWVPAPAGNTIGFAVASGPGALSAPSCMTTVGGSCSVTLSSPTAGITLVNASSTPVIRGVAFPVTTNGQAGSSGPLTKRWVDASISIAPNGVNEVGVDHTFTITVTALPSGASPVVFSSIITDVTPAPGSMSNTCANPQVNGNVATCTLTISNPSAGQFVANATATVSMGGTTVVRSTSGNAGPGGSGPAAKIYVDARIKLGSDGVNEVGHPHTIAGTVEINNGSGWLPAPDGTTIGYLIFDGPGALSAPSCDTGGGTGSCSITLTSTTPGVTHVNASTKVDVTVAGRTVPLTRSTDGNAGPGGSGPLTKRWIDGSISIKPNAFNEVRHAHTFTVEATVVASGAAPVVIDSITTSVAPAPDSQTTTCDAPVVTTSATGIVTATCELVIDSDIAAVYTANAALHATVAGVTLDRSTSATSGPGGSGPATKTYVDARITLAPNGVNEVGKTHTMTATVEVNDGSGWSAAPDGAVVTFAIVSGPGVLSSPTCTVSNGSGSCAVDVTSHEAGVTIVSASTNVVVNGVSVTRSTAGNAGPGGSGDLTKRWVDGSITIGPNGVNPIHQAHTFHIQATINRSGTDPVQGLALTVTVSPQPTSQTDTCSAPTLVDNGDTFTATCDATINSDVAAVYTANASFTANVGGVTLHRSTDAAVAPSGPIGSGPATKEYIVPTQVLGEVLAAPAARLPVTGENPWTKIWFAGLLLLAGGFALATGFVVRRRAR